MIEIIPIQCNAFYAISLHTKNVSYCKISSVNVMFSLFISRVEANIVVHCSANFNHFPRSVKILVRVGNICE